MKSARRRDLLKILHQGHAATQQEFVAALKAAGHDVTQATVSRDLQELGAIKIRLGDQVAYRFPDEALRNGNGGAQRTLERQLNDFAIDVRAASQMVVVLTLPGHAGLLARSIDLASVEGVLGTIAGDDTIFVATPDSTTADRIVNSWSQDQLSEQKGIS